MKFPILDEAGHDILAVPLNPSAERMIKLANSLKDGRVLSINAVAEKLGVNDRTVVKWGNSPHLRDYYRNIGRRSYLMNKATAAEYDKTRKG